MGLLKTPYKIYKQNNRIYSSHIHHPQAAKTNILNFEITAI